MAKGVPFPPEFRAEAVRLHRMSGRAMRTTAIEIGVAPGTLSRWVRQAEIDEGKAAGLTTKEREELRGLRKEIKLLREKRRFYVRQRFSSLGRPISADEV